MRPWVEATIKALGIFVYFALFTGWFPSWLLGLSGIETAPEALRDMTGFAVWLMFLVVGMWALRRLQKSGRI